jgi:cold shock CspA family protein
MNHNTETNKTVDGSTEQKFKLASNERYEGQVKWFNNKLGFGFITVCSENYLRDNPNNTDVFVHQANIRPSHNQYRTLTQGEYVSFNLGTTEENSQHKYQAVDIRGVKGGSLMCDQVRKPSTHFRGGGHHPRGSQGRSQEGEWQKVNHEQNRNRGRDKRNNNNGSRFTHE